MNTTTREKKQIHEIGLTTSRLITDAEGSTLALETRYPDNDGPTDVLVVTHHIPMEDGEVEEDTHDVVTLTNAQTAVALSLLDDPLLDTASHLLRLWTKHNDAARAIDKRMAWAKFEGAAEAVGVSYYGRPNSAVFVMDEVRTLWNQESGERPRGYGTAQEAGIWRKDMEEELAARLALSILENRLGVRR